MSASDVTHTVRHWIRARIAVPLGVMTLFGLTACGEKGTTQPEVTRPSTFALSVNTAGTGSGTISSQPAGISCPSGACTARYDAGTVVTLSAVPSSGSTFTGWNVTACATSTTCSVTITEARSVTASFTAVPAVQTTVSVVATDASASEVGPDIGVFTISRAGVTTVALSVNLTLTGSATNGTDYVAVPATATVPAGQSTVAVTITPLVDAFAEGAETVIVTVGAGSYTVGSPNSATVTIADANNVPGTLANGQLNRARLAVARQVDTWTFTAAAGDYVAISMGEVTSGSFIQPWIRLIGPTGELVAESNGSTGAQISIPVLTTGSYRVLAGSFGTANSEIGDYTLTLAKAREAVVVSPSDQGGPLANGGNYPGSLTAGDLDVFTFTATAGDYVALSVGETTSGSFIQPWIRLIGPGGGLVAENNGSTGAQISQSVLTSGTYIVIVGSFGNAIAETGNYTLNLGKGREPVTVSPSDQGGPLANGGNYPGTLTAGDLDVFTFTATAGDYVALSVGEVTSGSFLQPWIRLIGPSGELVAENNGSTGAQISQSVLTGGMYIVIVGSFGNAIAETGNYTLNLGKGREPVTVSPSDQGGPLANGGNYPGTLTAGDLDVFSFTATGGDYVALSVGEVASGSFLQPWIRLIGPSGELVAENNGSTGAQISQSVLTGGTYIVIVGSFGNAIAETGNYTLNLGKAREAVVVSPSDQGGPMANGANYPGTLTAGDLDVFTFTATAGDYVALSVGEVSAGSFIQPWIRLIGPDGALIAENNASTGAQVSQPILATGTYIVIVGSFGNAIAETGGYTLTLAKGPGAVVVTPGDQGGPITNATAVSGVLSAGDLDVFTFTAVAGTPVTIAVTRTGASSFIQPWIRLIGPTGELLGENNGTSSVQLSRTLPTAGTYTVIIGSFGNAIAETGNYTLTVTGIGVGAAAGIVQGQNP